MRIKGEWGTGKIWVDGNELLPDESLKVYNHSPDGFSWSYGGSGPSQLALALLLLVTDKDKAILHHQDFKWAYIAKLPQNNFEIDLDAADFIRRHDPLYQNPELRFKALRHKFYMLGYNSCLEILRAMGKLKSQIPADIKIPQDAMKDLLYQVVAEGKIDELEKLIDEEHTRKADASKEMMKSGVER